MEIGEYISFILGILIWMFVVHKITDKLLGVKKKKISETSGKGIERRGSITIIIIYLITLWFNNGSDIQRLFVLLVFLALLLGYQAIMEFIFIKESKQYISTAITLILTLVISYMLLNNYPFWV